MNSMIRSGAILGALAVVLGAFGAHALREILSDKGLALWETAVRYHFYHALALLVIGLLYDRVPSSRLRFASGLFVVGFVLFCGSLYALSFREVAAIKLSWLGPITPLGGVCFILAWLLLAFNPKGERQ
ncbi:MAG: hypothetical protein RLZZ630_1682 [Bacteroidota bacterium]|jgi:uncharacterized membrane protein YgdD (TMEM256/DUF423 family)